jgi:hypothetical protein
MRTSWEKLVEYVGAQYGHDISNELQNKPTVTLTEPVHSDTILARHTADVQIVREGQTGVQEARQIQKRMLEDLVSEGTDVQAPMLLAVLNNDDRSRSSSKSSSSKSSVNKLGKEMKSLKKYVNTQLEKLKESLATKNV